VLLTLLWYEALAEYELHLAAVFGLDVTANR
jgi:hypothetical protein